MIKINTRIFLLTLATLLMGAVTGQAKDAWLTDFDAALSKAKEENKIVLVDFQGSDWCPPCIKLHDEILTTDSFGDLAESSLVLVNADFPRKSKLTEAQQEHNNALARKYGVQYFPTVLLISPEGEVLDKMVGFPSGGMDGFMEFVKAQIPAKS